MSGFFTASIETSLSDLTVCEILWDVIPILALLIVASYYVFTSINTVKTRKAQLIVNLYNKFRDCDIMKRWS